MRSHVYFDGQLLNTQCKNISEIYKEIKQSDYYEELLVIFDDKLNIYRAKYFVEQIQEMHRKLKVIEINQMEIQRLEQKVKKTEESYKSDLKIVNQLNDMELQQLKGYISSLEEKQNFELKNLLNRYPVSNSNQEAATLNVHKQLSDKITQLMTDNIRLKQDLQRQNQESKIIGNKLQLNDDRNEQLKQQIDQIEQIRKTKDQEIQLLKMQVQELLTKIDKLEFELSQHRGSSQTSIGRVQNIKNDLKTQIRLLRQEKQDKEKYLLKNLLDMIYRDRIIQILIRRIKKQDQVYKILIRYWIKSYKNQNKFQLIILSRKQKINKKMNKSTNMLRFKGENKDNQNDQLDSKLQESNIVKMLQGQEIDRLKLIIFKLENQNSNQQELENSDNTPEQSSILIFNLMGFPKQIESELLEKLGIY
ncbi:hypothetical protein pb186bvf_012733 [Paramecium bursaria]